MMVKSISISISENINNPCKDYIINDSLLQYIINVVSSEYQYINFVWICTSEYNRIPFLKRVKLYQRRIAKIRKITIHNTIRMLNALPDKSLKKFCQKNNFKLESEFDDAEMLINVLSNSDEKHKVNIISVQNTRNADLIKVYTLAKEYCFNLRFKQNFIYSAQFNDTEVEEYLLDLKRIFDYWLKDKNGIFVKPFIDHIRNIYNIAIEKECINSSCLGKTLNIDSNGKIYLCAQAQNGEYALGDFKNYSSVSEIFQSVTFADLIEKMIQTRKSCIKKCSYFNFCQGGCCFCVSSYGVSKEYCKITKELNEYISNSIQGIIASNKSLEEFNPALASIVKEIISYNPAALANQGG